MPTEADTCRKFFVPLQKAGWNNEPHSIAEQRTDGVHQAEAYAEMLGLKFAYTTNGHETIEIDYTAGLERILPAYPSPDDLWRRYRVASGLEEAPSEKLLTLYNHNVGKGERYYQQIAISSAADAILKGRRGA